MPSARRSTTPVGVDLDAVEGRYAHLDDHTVSFETFMRDLDTAPYFRGLPGDACPCRHLGYVTSGQITFRWPDHEETYVEGDAYVAGPGHRPFVAAGASVVEFTLTEELEPVMEVLGRAIEAMAGAGEGAGAGVDATAGAGAGVDARAGTGMGAGPRAGQAVATS